MQLLVLLAFFAVVVSAVSSLDLKSPEWLAYKSKHGKVYKSADEEAMRLATYVEHKSKVDQHNERFAQGLETFQLETNKFADVPQAEFARRQRRDTSNVNYAKGKTTTTTKKTTTTMAPTTTTPTTTTTTTTTTAKPIQQTVDWRIKGAVTRVKDQGSSCTAADWAFSATGALEGQNFRRTGKLIALSEQNLLDCTIGYGNYGCTSGAPVNAFLYVLANNGIDTMDSYPYTGVPAKCAYNATNRGGICAGANSVPERNETALAEIVRTIGPVSVFIDASQPSFQLYRYGIYYEPACSDTPAPGRAVLVVGYGTDDTGLDYWIVKNSWGVNWGVDGYIYMARNRGNNCGIATYGAYPLYYV